MAGDEVVVRELVRLECLKLAHNHADTSEIILARAKTYFDWVMQHNAE